MNDLVARIKSYILMYRIPAVGSSIPLAMLTPYKDHDELIAALGVVCEERKLTYELENNEPGFKGTGRVVFKACEGTQQCEGSQT